MQKYDKTFLCTRYNTFSTFLKPWVRPSSSSLTYTKWFFRPKPFWITQRKMPPQNEEEKQNHQFWCINTSFSPGLKYHFLLCLKVKPWDSLEKKENGDLGKILIKPETFGAWIWPLESPNTKVPVLPLKFFKKGFGNFLAQGKV